MKLNEAIAKRLSSILDKQHLTPYAVAKQGGIPKQIVYDVVHCEYKKITVDNIYQITATLDMSLEEFFSDPIFKEITD